MESEPRMSRDEFFTHWLPRLTCWLGLFTLFLGMVAAAFRSWMETLFIALSVATFFAYFLVLFKKSAKEDALKRFSIAMLGVLPLAALWGLLLINTSDRISDRNYCRVQTHNNCKNIGLSLIPDDIAAKHVPTNIRDAAGTDLLSWRVSIQPYLGDGAYLNQFDQTHPWSAKENRPHLNNRPSTYGSNTTDIPPTHTLWQGFAGPGTAFEPGQRLNIARDFPDGLATTLLVIEGETSVPWTKPEDIAYGPNYRLPTLAHNHLKEGGLPFRGYVRDAGAYACMADGSVRFLRTDTSAEVLRAMIVRNNGQPAEIPE